jgi:hypothetical protein
LKTKWRIRPAFSITLHKKDLFILEKIKNYFNVGYISTSISKNTTIYAVDSIKEIEYIISHFDNYPLITQKFSDFLIFKECFYLIKQKEHLTDRGLLEIMSLKGAMNLGLPENIIKALPGKINIKKRPLCKFKGIPHPF